MENWSLLVIGCMFGLLGLRIANSVRLNAKNDVETFMAGMMIVCSYLGIYAVIAIFIYKQVRP